MSKYVNDKGKEYLNMNVIGLISTTTDDEENDDEEPEEKPAAKKTKAGKVTAKSKAVVEEDEPEEEEESEDDETSPEEYATWIGYGCSFVADEDTGETVEGSTTSYDADSNLFTVEDANGDQYEVYPDDLTWDEA
jgi:hypothetical protein